MLQAWLGKVRYALDTELHQICRLAHLAMLAPNEVARHMVLHMLAGELEEAMLHHHILAAYTDMVLPVSPGVGYPPGVPCPGGPAPGMGLGPGIGFGPGAGVAPAPGFAPAPGVAPYPGIDPAPGVPCPGVGPGPGVGPCPGMPVIPYEGKKE